MNKTSCRPRRPEVSPWRHPNKHANCPPLSGPIPMAQFDRGHVRIPAAVVHHRLHRRARPLSVVPAQLPSRFWPTASYPLDPADPRTPVVEGTWHVIHYVLKDHHCPYSTCHSVTHRYTYWHRSIPRDMLWRW